MYRTPARGRLARRSSKRRESLARRTLEPQAAQTRSPALAEREHHAELPGRQAPSYSALLRLVPAGNVASRRELRIVSTRDPLITYRATAGAVSNTCPG